jgi:hypothetical protein
MYDAASRSKSSGVYQCGLVGSPGNHFFQPGSPAARCVRSPNPHKALRVKRQYFPFPGTVRFLPRLRVTAAVARAMAPRPGLLSAADAAPGPRPWTSRTQHTCGLRRPRSAEQGGCARDQALAGPDTRSCPVPWPFEVRQAHLHQRRVPLGSAHGWGGSSGDCSSSWLRSGGGRVDFGRVLRHRARFNGDSFALISYRPPTHPRTAARPPRAVKFGNGRRPIQASGCRGYGQGHARADS